MVPASTGPAPSVGSIAGCPMAAASLAALWRARRRLRYLAAVRAGKLVIVVAGGPGLCMEYEFSIAGSELTVTEKRCKPTATKTHLKPYLTGVLQL